MSSQALSVFWFRRDLRLEDNHGLYQALSAEEPVLPLFIFDWNILNELPDSKDARVQFIHQEIESIKQRLEKKHGSSMLVKYGKPANVWAEILEDYPVKTVYCNRDYEPYGRERDRALYHWFKEKDIDFKGFKDQVIFMNPNICIACYPVFFQ